MTDKKCTCAELFVGGKPTGSKNINDDCPLHGIGTEYYRKGAERLMKRLRHIRAGRKDNG